MFQGPIAVYSDDPAAVRPLLVALRNRGLEADYLDAEAPAYDPAIDGDRYSLVLSCVTTKAWRRGRDFAVMTARYLERLEKHEIAVLPAAAIGWPPSGEASEPLVREVETRWASRAA